MAPRTTINNDDLSLGITLSAVTHVLFILFLYFGFPRLFKPLPKQYEPVPMTIVDISQLTNTRVKEPEEQPKPPTPPEQAAPKIQTQTTPAPPTPKPQPPAPPQPQQQAEAIDKVEPKIKPKPQEPPKEQKNNPLASVLKNVEKMKETATVKAPVNKVDPNKQTETKSNAPTLSERLSISEEDALRRQIQQCWNMPVGARDAQSLIVEVKITVNADRTVASAEIVDKSRMASDSFFRAAAESALRALYNPRCTPLELPPDKYDQWKVINFTFDPRDML